MERFTDMCTGALVMMILIGVYLMGRGMDNCTCECVNPVSQVQED